MGRALVRDPSVFLLDEPLSNLDAKLRAQIRADIAQIQKRLNKTTLYVTHDQVEAMTLGDRVAVMNAGELLQIGTPEELYMHPRNVFVAKFLGSPGMNILPATLNSNINNEGLVVRFAQQTLTLSAAIAQTRADILPYLNQSILMGIRPEAFHASQVKTSVGLKVKIVSVEFLGHESLVYFQLPQTDASYVNDVLVARIAGRFHPASTPEQTFNVDTESICLFNKDGQNILDKVG